MKRQLRLSSHAALAFRAASDLTPREPGVARSEGVVAVVPVVGPLEHRYSPHCGSYQGVLAMASQAFASGADAVVLDLETPGGDVVGLFDTCAALRGMADAAGIPLVGFVNTACSAGYALAATCDYIVVNSTGNVGSIGVISSLEDHTAKLEQLGVKVRLITSGERKADGNPAQAISDEAVAVRQAGVDKMAAQFISYVADRRALDEGDVAALQAAVLIGDDAVAAGLADSVESFSALVARLQKGETMSAAKAMLAKVAAAVKAGEIKPDEAAAALGLSAKAETEEDKPEARAEGEVPPKEDEEKAAAQAAAKAAASSHSAGIYSMLADPDFAAKASLIESRSDFTPLQQIALMGQPLSAVKAVVNFSKPQAVAPVAAAKPVAPTPVASAGTAVEAFAALQAGGPATVAAQAAAVAPTNSIEELAKLDPATAEVMGAAFGFSRPTTNVTSFDAKTNIQYIGHTPKGATVLSPTAPAK